VDWLQSFAEDIWIADGPIVRAFGFPFPTRMIVVRLASGDLWINSPVAASDEQMQRVTEIGPVKHLVSPTPLHDWRLESWSTAFPAARVWPAKGLEDEAPAAWSADIDQLVFRGSRVLNEVEFLHRKSRTVIFADFIQSYPTLPHKPVRNAAFKVLGVLNGGVGLDIRFSFIGNKSAGRKALERLLSWDFDRVILAHGPCVEGDAKPFIRRAFAWLSS
jgi:hypothetical protein